MSFFPFDYFRFARPLNEPVIRINSRVIIGTRLNDKLGNWLNSSLFLVRGSVVIINKFSGGFKNALPIIRGTCAFRSKNCAILRGAEFVSGYLERSKNCSKNPVFAFGYLRL